MSFVTTLTRFVTFILLVRCSRSCPAVCSCDYHRIVSCAGMQLKEIPSDVPTDTHALLLGSNVIQFVILDSFQDIPSLIELHLDRNVIGFIPSKAFSPLERLKFLDLGYNRITAVSRLAFSGLLALERLYLAGNLISTMDAESLLFVPHLRTFNLYDNPLTDLPDNFFGSSAHMTSLNIGKCHLRVLTGSTFKGLRNLTSLILSENDNLDGLQDGVLVHLPRLDKLTINHGGLKRVTSHAFAGLTNLKELLLDHNRLAHTLPLSMFEDIPHLEVLRLDGNALSSLHYSVIASLKNLKALHLDDNRWRCDCGLLGMRVFWSSGKPTLLTSPGIRCSYPEKYRDLSLWNIPTTSLVDSCLRNIEPNFDSMEIEMGSRVSLECSLPRTNGSYLAWFSSKTVYIPSSTNKSNNSRFQIQPDGALTIGHVTEEDVGPFICSVTYPDGATALRAVFLFGNSGNDAGNEEPSSPMTYVLIIASFGILTALILMLLLVVILQRNRNKGPPGNIRPLSYNPLSLLTLRTRRRIEEAYAYAYADVQQRHQPPQEIDAYAVSGNITKDNYNSIETPGGLASPCRKVYGSLSLDPSSEIGQGDGNEGDATKARDSDSNDTYAYVAPNTLHEQTKREAKGVEENEHIIEGITSAHESPNIGKTDRDTRESNTYIEILD